MNIFMFVCTFIVFTVVPRFTVSSWKKFMEMKSAVISGKNVEKEKFVFFVTVPLVYVVC